MFLFLEDTLDVREGIDQLGHCLLINCFQSNPPVWMIKTGQDVIMWSAVCSSAPHSQAAVEAIPHLCTVGATPHLCIVERNKLTPVRRRLSLTKNGLGRYISSGLGLTSGIKVKIKKANSILIWILFCKI